MRKILSVVMFAIVVGFAATAQKPTAKKTPSKPAPQVFDGRLEMTILGIEKVDEWKMFPSNPMSPKVTAENGQRPDV